MSRFNAGWLSGFVAVLVTSAVNLVGRFVGLLPESMDMKYMAELLIDPARNPITAFWVGLILHILGGVLVGVLFVLLVKRPTPLKGVGFALALVWIGMMLLIFPLTGRGLFGSNIGWAMPSATFLLNVVYGVVAGAFAQRLVIVLDGFTERIGEALTRALHDAIEAEANGDAHTVDLACARMIIFSDLHKGTRDRSDDFQIAEQAYNAALGYYYTMGHILVTMGDVEELWEDRINPVLENYQYTLKLEAKFHQEGRYLRFWGNHDDDWNHPTAVRQYLDPIYEGAPLTVREALRIQVTEAGQELGTLFMVHGHQGTIDSDRLEFLSKPLVRLLWKPFQNLTGISLNTPSKNWQLRDRHNRAMYDWASKQEKMILIVGHTHRPVFLSELHATKIRAELTDCEAKLRLTPEDVPLREKVSLLSAELEWVLSQERQVPGAEGTTRPTKPCHFNTGCCCFYDGDITGIEIANGEILLVRWPDDDGAPQPKILERAFLKDVFAAL